MDYIDFKRRVMAGGLSSVELSGIPPLLLTGSKGKPLKNYRIYGNTKRAITIGGVEYVVPDGNTLLDYIESSGTQCINTGVTANNIIIDIDIEFEIKQGLSYGNIISAQSTGANIRLLRLNNTGTRINWYCSSSSHDLAAVELNKKYVAKIHYESGASYIILDGVTTTDSTVFSLFDEYFIINAGKAGSDYRYLGANKIYSCVIKVGGNPVRVLQPAKNSNDVAGMEDLLTGDWYGNNGTGTFSAGAELPTTEHPLGWRFVGDRTENLWDKNNTADILYTTAESRGEISANMGVNNNNRTIIAYLKSGTYSFWADDSGLSINRRVTYYGNTRPTYGTTGGIKLIDYATDKTFTINNDGWVALWISNSYIGGADNPTVRDKIMSTFTLVKGSTVPSSYIPYGYRVPIAISSSPAIQGTITPIYLSAPLAKVNDADYIDSTRQIWHREIGVKVFDGTEDWSYESSYAYFIGVNLSDLSLPNTCLCTHYEGISSTVSIPQMLNNQIKCGYRAKNVYVKDTRFTSVSDLKAYLATQYAAGTPVTIWYPLATPVEESITLPGISAIAGGCYADVQTAVKPSNLQIKYLK